MPPSQAQAEVRNNKRHTRNGVGANNLQIFKKSLSNLFSNLNFILIFISYGNF